MPPRPALRLARSLHSGNVHASQIDASRFVPPPRADVPPLWSLIPFGSEGVQQAPARFAQHLEGNVLPDLMALLYNHHDERRPPPSTVPMFVPRLSARTYMIGYRHLWPRYPYNAPPKPPRARTSSEVPRIKRIAVSAVNHDAVVDKTMLLPLLAAVELITGQPASLLRATDEDSEFGLRVGLPKGASASLTSVLPLPPAGSGGSLLAASGLAGGIGAAGGASNGASVAHLAPTAGACALYGFYEKLVELVLPRHKSFFGLLRVGEDNDAHAMAAAALERRKTARQLAKDRVKRHKGPARKLEKPSLPTGCVRMRLPGDVMMYFPELETASNLFPELTPFDIDIYTSGYDYYEACALLSAMQIPFESGHARFKRQMLTRGGHDAKSIEDKRIMEQISKRKADILSLLAKKRNKN